VQSFYGCARFGEEAETDTLHAPLNQEASRDEHETGNYEPRRVQGATCS
jgi:hypothetical protein